MKEYRQIKARLSKEEQAGLNNLLARVKEKREMAIKAQGEVRDDGGQRTVQE